MVKPLFISKMKEWNINKIINSEIHICQLDKHLLCKLQQTSSQTSNLQKET